MFFYTKNHKKRHGCAKNVIVVTKKNSQNSEIYIIYFVQTFVCQKSKKTSWLGQKRPNFQLLVNFINHDVFFHNCHG